MSILNKIKGEIRKIKKSDERDTSQITVPEAIIATRKTVRNQDSARVYDNLMYQQRMLAFRKTHDANALSESNRAPDIDDLSGFTNNFLEDLDDSVFQQSWGRLNKEHKINRVLHFVNETAVSRNLPIDLIKKLRRLLIKGIIDKKITRKNDVDYVDGKIVSIKALQWSQDGEPFLDYEMQLNENPSSVPVIRTIKLTDVKRLGPLGIDTHGDLPGKHDNGAMPPPAKKTNENLAVRPQKIKISLVKKEPSVTTNPTL